MVCSIDELLAAAAPLLMQIFYLLEAASMMVKVKKTELVMKAKARAKEAAAGRQSKKQQ